MSVLDQITACQGEWAALRWVVPNPVQTCCPPGTGEFAPPLYKHAARLGQREVDKRGCREHVRIRTKRSH